MQRRIFGIETEFGVTCTFHGQRRLSPDEVARYLFRRGGSWGGFPDVFLRNGSRLYPGVGPHPEDAPGASGDPGAPGPPPTARGRGLGGPPGPPRPAAG